jgi:O-antigen/teichoic acid export membrane protein
LIHTAWVFQLGVSAFILIGALVIACVLTAEDVGIITINDGDLAILIIGLGVVSVLTIGLGPLVACYRVVDKYARGVFLQNSGRLLDALILTAALILKADKVQACGFWVLCRIAWFAWVWFDVRKNTHGVNIGIKEFSWPALRAMFAPGFGFLAFPVGQLLQVQCATIWVGRVLGPEAVVMLNLLRVISGLASQAVNIVSYGAMPELSSRIGRGDISSAQRLHFFIIKISLGLSVLLTIVATAIGPLFVHYWTRAALAVPALWVFGFMLEKISYSLWLSTSAVIGATNNHAKLSLAYLALNMVFVVLMICFLDLFGLMGIPVVLFIINIVVFCVAWRASARLWHSYAGAR